MNSKECDRLTAIVGKLLDAVPKECSGVRASLREIFDEAKSNVVSRSRMHAVSDILSGAEFCSAHGVWLIAEVEGSDVQFNRLIGEIRPGSWHKNNW